MAVGSAISARPLLQRFRTCQGTAGAFLRWFALSYGLGFVAIVPSLLRHFGASQALWQSPWMNVFLLFPLIDGLRAGGLFIGEAAVLALFSIQYGAMLLMIRRLECPRDR
jgi:hypothetical protein